MTARSRAWYAEYRDALEERFASYVDIQPNGCWEWIGPVSNHAAYPVCYTGLGQPRRVSARILAWYLTHDELIEKPDCPWPAVCRNPSCVAPEHLVRCSRTDVQVYRGNTVLTPQQVLDIYDRLAKGYDSVTGLAEEYGVDQELVSMIALGTRWSSITSGVSVRRPPLRIEPTNKARAVAAVLRGEKSVREAAAMNSVPSGTVCSWLYRYRRRVRSEWVELVDQLVG